MYRMNRQLFFLVLKFPTADHGLVSVALLALTRQK
jgi:hypothetical protein